MTADSLGPFPRSPSPLLNPEPVGQWEKKNIFVIEDSGLTSTFIDLQNETHALHFILTQELFPICFGWSSVMQQNMFSDIKRFLPNLLFVTVASEN